jgi:TPR repeat protein
VIAKGYLSIVHLCCTGGRLSRTGDIRPYTLKVVASYDPEYANELFSRAQYEQVVDYCRPFANQCVAAAQCTLGTMYQLGLRVGAEPSIAENLLLKAAAQDFPVAWCNLGTLYASGALGSEDHAWAEFCYRRAAELGGPSNADYL